MACCRRRNAGPPNYYVHLRDGNDTNDGLSLGNAFRTLTKADTTALTGHVIEMHCVNNRVVKLVKTS